jgi:hypothetical protein
MLESLASGFLLDRQWHWMRGEAPRSKEPDLSLVAVILALQTVPYAVIGALALQIHRTDPRTAPDIDIALLSLFQLPRGLLLRSGFRRILRHGHSDNWVGPEGTPIQFTDDPALAGPVTRAVSIEVGGLHLRVLAVKDLLHEKLRSGRDPARRRSKRLQDLADAQALIEQDPTLNGDLDRAERQLLDSLPR